MDVTLIIFVPCCVFSESASFIAYSSDTGVSQLDSFVEICNITAGEEEFNMKRLSYLHSVSSNFAALIYELPDDADFNKFDEKCKTVESLLEQNPKLAESLVSIGSYINFMTEFGNIHILCSYVGRM